MTMSARRRTSRRIVVELVAVAILAGFGDEFPRQVSPGTAWSFLFRHVWELGHAAVGTAILIEALVLVVRSERRGTSSARLLPVVGLAFVGAAVGSGVWFVARGQSESALTSMTTGWVGALGAYATNWYAASRTLRAASRAAVPTAGR